LVVSQDGRTIIIIVTISISELISVGQVVNHNVIHWVLPCYAYLILPPTIGLLIKYLNRDTTTHGLVTLIYQKKTAISNGIPDVALPILLICITTITTMIVLIYLVVIVSGMLLMIPIIVIFHVAVNIL